MGHARRKGGLTSAQNDALSQATPPGTPGQRVSGGWYRMPNHAGHASIDVAADALAGGPAPLRLLLISYQDDYTTNLSS